MMVFQICAVPSQIWKASTSHGRYSSDRTLPHKGSRGMTKSELIARLAARFRHLVTKDAEIVVRTIHASMSQALQERKRIEIRGFGSFSVSHRPPRVARNPKSGEAVRVPEKFLPHFRAGKELRERICEPAVGAAARKWGD
jgi:integration host factor subunit beta